MADLRSRYRAFIRYTNRLVTAWKAEITRWEDAGINTLAQWYSGRVGTAETLVQHFEDVVELIGADVAAGNIPASYPEDQWVIADIVPYVTGLEQKHWDALEALDVLWEARDSLAPGIFALLEATGPPADIDELQAKWDEIAEAVSSAVSSPAVDMTWTASDIRLYVEHASAAVGTADWIRVEGFEGVPNQEYVLAHLWDVVMATNRAAPLTPSEANLVLRGFLRSPQAADPGGAEARTAREAAPLLLARARKARARFIGGGEYRLAYQKALQESAVDMLLRAAGHKTLEYELIAAGVPFGQEADPEALAQAADSLAESTVEAALDAEVEELIRTTLEALEHRLKSAERKAGTAVARVYQYLDEDPPAPLHEGKGLVALRDASVHTGMVERIQRAVRRFEEDLGDPSTARQRLATLRRFGPDAKKRLDAVRERLETEWHTEVPARLKSKPAVQEAVEKARRAALFKYYYESALRIVSINQTKAANEFCDDAARQVAEQNVAIAQSHIRALQREFSTTSWEAWATAIGTFAESTKNVMDWVNVGVQRKYEFKFQAAPGADVKFFEINLSEVSQLEFLGKHEELAKSIGDWADWAKLISDGAVKLTAEDKLTDNEVLAVQQLDYFLEFGQKLCGLVPGSEWFVLQIGVMRTMVQEISKMMAGIERSLARKNITLMKLGMAPLYPGVPFGSVREDP